MELAVVTGQCTATVKDTSLGRRRFALVQTVDPSGNPIGRVEVALDVTAAAAGQMVLLTRGSAARLPADIRQIATDLSIVAIIDEVTVAAPRPPSEPARGATPISPAPRPRTKRTGGK